MIPISAFTREPESLIQEQVSAMERVIRSGWWILGKEVEAFEKEWCAWSGCAHSVGVGNGMDALEIGLRVLEIGPGDEVITTPMTAFATVLSILKVGATPVLADINPETAIMSVESVARCMGSKTKAIIVVHLYGQAAPLMDFNALCQNQNIHLIEDCAQAHGAQICGNKIGTVGIFAGWSFYPTKNLGTVGDGGAFATQNLQFAEKARQLRNYGQSVRYHHPYIGLNSRLDELHAAILRARLPYLSSWNLRRKEIAMRYSLGISNPFIRLLPIPKDPLQHVHHLFVICSQKRDVLSIYLKEQGIETLIHYPIPVHHQEPCRNVHRDPLGLGCAEEHARTCLSLPCNPFLSDKEVEVVIAVVNKFKG
jgi:dTDP-4-amino-4,6-dideoxygalactose transaminase